MMLGQFSPAVFTHEDHLGVAFELLRQCDFPEAINVYTRAIRGFATRSGAPQKFNTTVTIAFLAIVAERSRADQTFAQFMACNPDLRSKDMLSHWYSKETLNSDLARNIFVMPAPLKTSRASIQN